MEKEELTVMKDDSRVRLGDKEAKRSGRTYGLRPKASWASSNFWRFSEAYAKVSVSYMDGSMESGFSGFRMSNASCGKGTV